MALMYPPLGKGIAGRPERPEEQKASVLVKMVEAMMGEKIRWDLELSPLHMGLMLHLRTEKTQLGRTVDLMRFEGQEIDRLARMLVNDFRSMLDDQVKKAGYPSPPDVKKYTPDKLPYPWQAIDMSPMNKHSAEKIMDKHLTAMQNMMLDQISLTVGTTGLAVDTKKVMTYMGEEIKKKEKPYHQQLQEQVDAWLK